MDSRFPATSFFFVKDPLMCELAIYCENRNNKKRSRGTRFEQRVDVGSTTVKIAVVDPVSARLIFGDYRRHNAERLGGIRMSGFFCTKA